MMHSKSSDYKTSTSGFFTTWRVKASFTGRQLERWLSALRSNNRDMQRTVRAEIEAQRAVPSLNPEPEPEALKSRLAYAERVVKLMSRGDHRRDFRDARAMGLTPVQVSAYSLKPGQSPEAHTVQAPESLASKLITSGNWSRLIEQVKRAIRADFERSLIRASSTVRYRQAHFVPTRTYVSSTNQRELTRLA